MKIFITGGNGFLGKQLKKHLLNTGHEVISPTRSDCDLRENGSLSLFREDYDVIFHLAAYTQAGDWCLKHPGEQWLINQMINTNVLNWWCEKQSQAKMVAIGTSCSYSPKMVLTEKNYMLGEPIESLYTYAMTKRMLLQGLHALNKQYAMKYLYVVPSTLYGPAYHTDGRQMHFIFDLIRKILRGKHFGEKVELWGDGYQRREIVHVDDFILNMLELLHGQQEGVYNLGSGKEYSIREFAKTICEIVNYEFSEISFDLTKYVGAKSKVLEVKKAQKVLQQYRDRDIRIGLSEVISWFEESKSF